ncbi:DUF4376 domain-containing protein [Agathobaculum sp. LCP25S3_E8]|uniref:DUF4376 domain-containing protein n=1 Tax=Agathobaculum sp. LCP25S3_E8 TaxID=3438735 RepID=UPI003F8FF0DE
MYYIHQTPNSAGNYGNPMGEPFDGCLALPDELLPAYIQANGFVTIAVQDDTVTSVEKNEAAWEAWNAAQPPVDLDALRAAKQEQNKKALADWLAVHPLTWTDGKVYGVTEQDQTEMAINLAQYQLAAAAGQPAVLEWHTQKKSCHTFTREEYTALSLAIAAYVYPYRRYLEAVKEAIYEAQSKEELDAIEIDYGGVGGAAYRACRHRRAGVHGH